MYNEDMDKYIFALTTSILFVGTVLLIGAFNLFWIDSPQYADGEATAMVERVCSWRENSADYYATLSEEYVGDGVWEVKSTSKYDGEQATFKVYERTDTVQIVNDTAREILKRQSQLSEED